MSEEQRLQQRIAEHEQRFNTLSEKIALLQKAKNRETRPDELFRLNSQITDLETERSQVEMDLQGLEAEQKKYQLQNLIQDARRMERNKAFAEALKAWETIRSLDPGAAYIGSEIQRLLDRQKQHERLNDLIRQLTRRLAEIKPIYKNVIARLRQMGETGVTDESLLNIVSDLLQEKLPADLFMEAWQALEADISSTSTTDEPDYQALADRLRRGEIVLFLGPDTPRLLDADVPVPETLVPMLAQQARYQDFSGPLSMIAEYYQMKPEHGRSSLIRNLRTLIAVAPPAISLYQLLAKIEQPLVLISAAYDLLLENAFQQAGKKYALISSIICSSSDYDIGNVFVHYSDKDKDTPESLHLEEKLSGIKLLDEGYSLIYKMRGYCAPDEHHAGHQHNTLALSEENYFTFARYIEKLIPSYVVKQFTGRGLFFLGYSPRHWEDRLLINAILDKRRHRYEPAYTISRDTDPFIRAYWESRGVRRYAIELQEFVRKLEANFS